MSEPTVGERLAVIESTNHTQTKLIQEILDEVKTTSASMIECKTKVDALDKLDLPGRVTRVETRQKIFVGIGAGLISLTGILSVLRDQIKSFF